LGGARVLRRLVSGLLAASRSAGDANEAELRAALDAGVEHAKAGRFAEAERSFLAALRLAPRNPDALNLLGLIAFQRAHYDAARDYFHAAIEHGGAVAEFEENLGKALQALGRDEEAEAAYRAAVALEPQTLRYNLSLLFLLNQRHAGAPERLLAEHRDCFGRLLRDDVRLPLPADRLADPERRLRVGYLSGDFRAHAVAYFLDALLAARDPAAFEVHCYHTIADEDERTAQLRDLADRWHPVAALSDEALAALVVEHGIDILVDLAGLTNGNRVHVVARKPAPVQIGYLGYLGTTGIDALDYRITDARADPPGDTDRWHGERLIRLPDTLWCFTPRERMPEPLARADGADSPLVFGSFNRLAKVRPAVLALWGRLLAQVPDAEIWFADVTSDESHERLLASLAAAGVARERVRTRGRLPPEAYWDLVRRADIALDTFPYNGGATTCECLWLGVPVVTRAGAMGFARSGASILGAVGLAELVADSDADYLRIAAALAADRPRLRALQRSLRERMRGSPLTDAPRFMRNLERAYRETWRTACEGSSPAGA
jgi:predicted O-linked N-acetylglucosamine transferase (SPINDLY family)